mgnify:CR=1 FL=1
MWSLLVAPLILIQFRLALPDIARIPAHGDPDHLVEVVARGLERIPVQLDAGIPRLIDGGRPGSHPAAADDRVAAGRDRLAAIPGVDPARVGLIGMSQGGSWVVPAAITLTDDLPWVVNVVGTTVTPNEQLRHETRQTLRQKGVPGWLVPVIEPVAVWVPKRRRSQWWDLNGDYDPMPAWVASDMPVLVVYGGEDETDNVPVGESLARLAPLMRPPSRFRVEVFEDSGHGLYTPGTRTIRPEFLALLAAGMNGVAAAAALWRRAVADRTSEAADQRQAALEAAIAAPDFYQQDHTEVEARLAELSKLQSELEQALERWTELEDLA